jgi:flagellum-specific ATP synthase
MAAYRDKEDLIAIGAYQAGTDPLTDAAIAARGPIEGFLKQFVDEPTSAEEADLGLGGLAALGQPDSVPVATATEEPLIPASGLAPEPGGTPLHSAIPPLNLAA